MCMWIQDRVQCVTNPNLVFWDVLEFFSMSSKLHLIESTGLGAGNTANNCSELSTSPLKTRLGSKSRECAVSVWLLCACCSLGHHDIYNICRLESRIPRVVGQTWVWMCRIPACNCSYSLFLCVKHQ